MHWTMVPRRSAAYHLGATMLRRLRIENLVLIKEAELAFAPGLNAITGETGAGKTILAQAIGLLLGAKGDAGYIGADGTEAYVEAELDLPAGLIEEDELATLAGEGVQSLLLEGGPTLAAAFLEHGVVDRLLVFIAPVLAGGGVPMLAALTAPLDLGAPEIEPVGEDVLLSWRRLEA